MEVSIISLDVLVYCLIFLITIVFIMFLGLVVATSNCSQSNNLITCLLVVFIVAPSLLLAERKIGYADIILAHCSLSATTVFLSISYTEVHADMTIQYA